MMGPLHTEMIFLDIIGTWLNGGYLYENSGINTSGRVNRFLKGNHVKRGCYAQQITLADLVIVAHQA